MKIVNNLMCVSLFMSRKYAIQFSNCYVVINIRPQTSNFQTFGPFFVPSSTGIPNQLGRQERRDERKTTNVTDSNGQ